MAINTIISHTQDLHGQLKVIPLRHVLTTGDQLGDRFDVTVTMDGDPVDLSSAGVTGYFVRPDQKTVALIGSTSGNVATVSLEESCYVVPGQYMLVIKVSLGNVRHAVYACTGTVARSSTNDLIDPGHNIPDINELLAMIAQIEAAVNSANTAAGNADKAATAANTAKSNADKAAASATTAADRANTAATAAEKWQNVTAKVTMLDADKQPVVTLTDTSTGKSFSFQLPRGLTGLTPELTVGKVTTGLPGTEVVVELRGTAEHPIMDLTIPQGKTGAIENLSVTLRGDATGYASGESGSVMIDVTVQTMSDEEIDEIAAM